MKLVCAVTFHHEFFHMVDYTRGTLNGDDLWESLNP